MKRFKDQCAQGDMLITRVGSIPTSHKKVISEREDHIIAHSETGHHHVVSAQTADFYQAANQPMVSFLHVKKPTPLRHLRDFDTHEPIMLDPGVYKVNRQREWTPEMERMVDD